MCIKAAWHYRPIVKIELVKVYIAPDGVDRDDRVGTIRGWEKVNRKAEAEANMLWPPRLAFAAGCEITRPGYIIGTFLI